MLTVIIPRTEEPTVIQLTQENLQRELSTINGAELLVCDSWEEGVKKARNIFVSLVEPDCVVSSGYYASNLGLFRKNMNFKKLGMVSSCVGVNNFGVRVYGYHIDRVWSEPTEVNGKQLQVSSNKVTAVRQKTSNGLYPVQIGFLPGAIIRHNILHEYLVKTKRLDKRDLVKMSTDLSLYMWDRNRRIHMNPNTTYVSTDTSLDNPPGFNFKVGDTAAGYFEREMQ